MEVRVAHVVLCVALLALAPSEPAATVVTEEELLAQL
jgi:hypothetical protein